jgi:hypothetical protein
MFAVLFHLRAIFDGFKLFVVIRVLRLGSILRVFLENSLIPKSPTQTQLRLIVNVKGLMSPHSIAKKSFI